MKFNLISTKEILDFEKEIGHELVVNERNWHNPLNAPKYYVYFENSEVSRFPVLIGSYGNGNTMDEAIRDYCKEISCKRLVFNAQTANRTEILVPKLIHTKLLNS